MSSSELSRLLNALLIDKSLFQKLSKANSLLDAARISQLVGFDISWQDWIRYQARLLLSLSEEQMSHYSLILSNGIKVLPHGTYIPVLGSIDSRAQFEWVLPFDAEINTSIDT